MSEIDAIPADVCVKVDAIFAEWESTGFLRGTLIRALLAERTAQRERDAVIAEDDDGHFSYWGEDRNTRVARQTCADIAAAIRNPKQQEPAQ